jgi:hypothetical protein
MPEYQFDEKHRILVHAPPERALEAARLATPGEMPLVRLLFGIRSLPAIVLRRSGLPTARDDSLYEQMLDFGFVFLAEEPGRELVAGVIGQMWKIRGGSAPAIRNAREFVAFEEPGYAKAALNFSVEPQECGGTDLRTETRVLTTDSGSRRSFGRYWRIISPGSAAIRRSWLGAAKHRAERSTQTDSHVPSRNGRMKQYEWHEERWKEHKR